jgi:hypothetical protein
MKTGLIYIIILLNLIILILLLTNKKKESFCVSCSKGDQSISTAYLSDWKPSPCAYNLMAYY